MTVGIQLSELPKYIKYPKEVQAGQFKDSFGFYINQTWPKQHKERLYSYEEKMEALGWTQRRWSLNLETGDISIQWYFNQHIPELDKEE